MSVPMFLLGFKVMRKGGKFYGCEKRRALRIPIVSLDSVPTLRCEDALVIRRPGFFGSCDGEKNGLRHVRAIASDVLRSQDAPDPGSLVWRYPRVSGGRNPACPVPELWRGEAGAPILDRRQSLLHEAICLLCGTTLPGLHPAGRGQRASSELEDGQGAGQAVYARATPANRDAGASGHRDR